MCLVYDNAVAKCLGHTQARSRQKYHATHTGDDDDDDDVQDDFLPNQYNDERGQGTRRRGHDCSDSISSADSGNVRSSLHGTLSASMMDSL